MKGEISNLIPSPSLVNIQEEMKPVTQEKLRRNNKHFRNKQQSMVEDRHNQCFTLVQQEKHLRHRYRRRRCRTPGHVQSLASSAVGQALLPASGASGIGVGAVGGAGPVGAGAWLTAVAVTMAVVCLLGQASPAHASPLASGGQELHHDDAEARPPMFMEAIPNRTVTLHRDTSLTCMVGDLGEHQVAWIHLNRQMIVSIHKQVITRQPRFSVAYDSHKTWTLHITGVELEDSGDYMCQVNSDPMISQKGTIKVVVPPNIVDAVSSPSSIVVREKENVTLRCHATGTPEPTIKWKREDNQKIELPDGTRVPEFKGNELNLAGVSRTHMGAYLCIASNNIPPMVSKRITIDTHFSPQMNIPNQLMATPQGSSIDLECLVEAHPPAITYWEFNGTMVINDSIVTTETITHRYKTNMILAIRRVRGKDFGLYKCIAKNSIGETNGSITLNEIPNPSTIPPLIRHNALDYDGVGEGWGHDGSRRGSGKRRGPKEQEHWRRTDNEDRWKEHTSTTEEGGPPNTSDMDRHHSDDMSNDLSSRRSQERQRLEQDFPRGNYLPDTRVTHMPTSTASLPSHCLSISFYVFTLAAQCTIYIIGLLSITA